METKLRKKDLLHLLEQMEKFEEDLTITSNDGENDLLFSVGKSLIGFIDSD